MYLTCVYDHELQWFYGNHVCILLCYFFLSFLVFFSIINQCLPFMAKKRVHFILHTTAELMERNQNSNPNPKPKP